MKNVLFAIALTCLCFTSGGLYLFATGHLERPACSYLSSNR